MIKLARRVWRGLDLHVLMTLLFRGWSILAGVLTLILIPTSLSPLQQGYYYTFASILALQVFFELGLGQVVVQVVAHEVVHLRRGADGRIEGDEESLSRVAQLRSLLRLWYVPAACAFGLLVCAGGLLFLRGGGLAWQQWAIPWVLLVIASAANLVLSWKLSMLEGFALVRDVAQLRLRQSMVGYALLWAGLLLGGELWVVAAVPLTAALMSAHWLHTSSVAPIFVLEPPRAPKNPIRWFRDIFPFQWRIAVSWASGYFVFHLFTPLVFRQSGAAEAGRLGLAMAIFSAISLVSMSWITAKAPMLSMHIARRESRELMSLFRVAATRSVLTTAVIATLVLAAAWAGSFVDMPFMQRIAPLPVLACLAVVTVLNSVIFVSATFMRAHREEPMLAVSVVGGLLTAGVAWQASTRGATGLMLGYLAVTATVALPWTLLIFRRFIARHRVPKGAASPDGTPSP